MKDTAILARAEAEIRRAAAEADAQGDSRTARYLRDSMYAIGSSLDALTAPECSMCGDEMRPGHGGHCASL